MRILTVHNLYQQQGGEEVVFKAELRLLQENGNIVDSLTFDNGNIKTPLDRLLSGFRLIYNSKSAARLEKKLLDFLPDIIHVHNFIAEASPSIFFVARKFGIPMVVTLHNYRLICPSGKLFFNNRIYEKSVDHFFPVHAVLRGVYRNSILQTAALAICMSFHNIIGTWRNNVNKFIILTDFALRKFNASKLSVNRDQLVVKPNFVHDCGVGKEKREDFFLFAGRLSEEKGIAVLLKAASVFHFNLTIIGSGPLSGLVLQYARKYTNISFHGFLDHASVIDRMKCCTALILPSLWYEGFPVSILESFSTGTPVIVSKIGSLSDIVENNVNGLHFECGNETDLISKIQLLLTDPALSGYLGLKARETYLQKFTPEKNYQMLMNIYNSAIHDMKVSRHKTVQAATAAENIFPEASNTVEVPRVSVGIPTFNGEKKIIRALNSVFRQNYPDIEIVISDNCSRDNTGGVIREMLLQHPEIRYFRQTRNIGVVPNFDFTLSKATGRYFIWLADDDELEPGCLQKYVTFMEENPEYVLVSGQILYWKGKTLDSIEKKFSFNSGHPAIRTLQYYNRSIYGGMFHGMMRRKAARKIPSRNVFGTDVHFVAALCYLGKIKNLDFPGYNKSLGGYSSDIKNYTRTLNESGLAATLPHFKLSIDAFAEIMYRSSVFKHIPFYKRLPLAILCLLGSFFGYYGRIVPRTIGGKIKRFILSTLHIHDNGSWFKRRSIAR